MEYYVENITMFMSQFLYFNARKIESVQEVKLNFSSSFFITDKSHVKSAWPHAAVSSKHDILHF